MKRASVFLVCLLFFSVKFYGQDTADLSLDVLKAPASPGSVMLGANPTEIERPTDLAGLMLSIRNATNDFTSLPSSFAIDLAPKWLLDRKRISFSDFLSHDFKQTFSQSFLISIAHLSQKDDHYEGLKQAIGFKFSLLRGKIRDTGFLNRIERIRNILSRKLDLFEKIRDSLRQNEYAEMYNSLERLLFLDTSRAHQLLVLQQQEQLDLLVGSRAQMIRDSLLAGTNIELIKLEENQTPVRKGFFLDLAGGTLIRYDNFKFSKTELSNYSGWINLGFEGLQTDEGSRSFFSLILLSRIIGNNRDELFKSGINKGYNTWDNGLRIAFTTFDHKLSLSGEGITRNYFYSDADLSGIHKYLLNIEYRIGKNKRLTFSYGKDFGGRVTKDGNVVALLNFVSGFLNRKTFTMN